VSAAQLAADQASVDSAVAQVAVARQNLDQSTMVSPIEGTVAAVNIVAGSPTPSGSTAHVVVIGPGSQQVTTQVSDLDVGSVKVGAPAEVTPSGATAAPPLKGTVTAVGALNIGTAAAPAYQITIGLAADAPNSPAGQSASVSISTAHVSDVIAVPSSAIRTSGSERTVTLLDGGSTRAVPVEIGAVGPTLTEITSGIQPGDKVVLADLQQPLPSLTTSGVRAVTGGGGGGGGAAPAGGGTAPTGGR
jgi:multidrug efflux pump subunit AcrA (membrane-fusion protein)